MAARTYKYSIVIPAYQEEIVIDASLINIHDYLVSENLLDDTEIIVVAADGGDDTALIAKRRSELFSSFTLIEPGRKVGKGRDVRMGMLAAVGDCILFMDADLATPIRYVRDVFEKLENDSDVVIGIRNLSKIHKGYRSYLSRCTNLLTRAVVLPGIADTQCGFKGFTHAAAQEIFVRSVIPAWSFDIEVLAIARNKNFTISQIPIEGWHDPKLEAGFVGENALGAVARSLAELVRIRLRLWLRKYK